MVENQTPSFGRYQLKGVLGSGGMAVVFLAEFQGAEGFVRKYALKVLRPQLLTRENAERANRSFISEARLGGALNHPNIVRTLDFGEIGGCYYLAMDYVDGPSLRTLLHYLADRGERLPLDISLQILQEVCSGLAYAHGAVDGEGRPLSIVHRDIKPANILLSLKGEVLISDFGVARAESNLDRTLVAGVVKGTAAYMSPEQATGSPLLDQRSDLFSLCLIAYELFTGKRLYEAATSEEARRAACVADVEPRLAVLAREPLGAELAGLLRRGLQKRPSMRFQTGLELRASLEAVLERLPRVRRLRPWLEAGAAEILEVVGIPVRPVLQTASGELSDLALDSSGAGSGGVSNVVDRSASMELELNSAWEEGDDEEESPDLRTVQAYRVDSRHSMPVPPTSVSQVTPPEEEGTDRLAPGLGQGFGIVDAPTDGFGALYDEGEVESGREATIQVPEALIRASMQMPVARRADESTVHLEDGETQTQTAPLDPLEVEEGGSGRRRVVALTGVAVATVLLLGVGAGVGWSLLPKEAPQAPLVVVGGEAAPHTPRPFTGGALEVVEATPATAQAAAEPQEIDDKASAPKPPAPKPSAVRPKARPAAAASKPKRPPSTAPAPTAPAEAQKTQAGAAAEADATLQMGSRSAVRLFVDGKDRGETPVSDVRLKPGAHTLKVVAPDGTVVEQKVSLGAGESWKCGADPASKSIRCQKIP